MTQMVINFILITRHFIWLFQVMFSRRFEVIPLSQNETGISHITYFTYGMSVLRLRVVLVRTPSSNTHIMLHFRLIRESVVDHAVLSVPHSITVDPPSGLANLLHTISTNRPVVRTRPTGNSTRYPPIPKLNDIQR